MRTRNQAPSTLYSAVGASSESPKSQNGIEQAIQKQQQNPENSDQKPDSNDFKPATSKQFELNLVSGSTRQSTQQVQDAKLPQSQLKDNRLQGSQQGASVSDYRLGTSLKNGDTAQLQQPIHPKQSKSDEIDSQNNQIQTDKSKQAKTQPQLKNKKIAPSNQRDSSQDVTKVLNPKSTPKTHIQKKENSALRKGESTTDKMLNQESSSQKQLTTDKKKNNTQKLDGSKKYAQTQLSQSQQGDTGSRDLLCNDMIEPGEHNSISASQNNNLKRRKGAHGLAINLQAKKQRIQNQQPSRLEQQLQNVRASSNSEENKNDDDEAFWALVKIFINCHLHENRDLKNYEDSNSGSVNISTSQNAIENHKEKNKQTQVVLQSQLQRSSLNNKKRNEKAKSKLKRAQPQEEEEDFKQQQVLSQHEPQLVEELNRVDAYMLQLQQIEPELNALIQIKQAYEFFQKFLELQNNNQLSDDEIQQKQVHEAIEDSINILQHYSIIDQEGKLNSLNIQELETRYEQKRMQYEYIQERLRAIQLHQELHEDDINQVRQYLQGLGDEQLQQKLVQELQRDSSIDEQTELAIQTRLHQMGIDLSSFMETQPNTYQLFKVLYCSNRDLEEVEREEQFQRTLEIVKFRQDQLNQQQQNESHQTSQPAQQSNQYLNQNDIIKRRNQINICHLIQIDQINKQQEYLQQIQEARNLTMIPTEELVSAIEAQAANEQQQRFLLELLEYQQRQAQAQQFLEQSSQNAQFAQLQQQSDLKQDITPDEQAQNNVTPIQEQVSEFQQTSNMRELNNQKDLSALQKSTDKMIEQIQVLLKSDNDRKREILLTSDRAAFNSGRRVGITEQQNQDQPAEISQFQTHINQEERVDEKDKT